MAARFGPIAGTAAEELPVDVLREAEDEGVEDDDVGHREEGDDATRRGSPVDAARRGGAAFGDLEEAVDAARRTTPG
jgi:hypothetical protein